MVFKGESESTEFKQSVGSGAIKAIISFANTSGGTIYIGVDDDGTVCGVNDVDAELTKLSSMMRDSIRPDILMGVSCNVEAIDGKSVIVLHVQRGTKRPYYLASKGPRPEGVFVRSGAASVPATDTAILHMIKESERDAFEARSSLRQDLTFAYAGNEFARRHLRLEEGELRTLGALLPDGTFTNLGLLLSDQCPPTIKAALFADDERNTFMMREEYSGSILKQLADAYAFLERNNKYRTEFNGLERCDHHDVPPVALREALVNSVAHREYALSGPTLVSVMPSEVEIVSPGGLPTGIEEADLGAHISIPRNKELANALFRLEIIEAYGTGIGRMRQSYAGSGATPVIKLTPNTFTILLPNRNATGNSSQDNARSKEEKLVISLLADGAKTRQCLQESLGTSQTTTIRILGGLVERGIIVKQGASRSTMYALT